ncbi:hypothetical protein BGZ90_010593 [Linnemannia elongata]|nr:hypothetical protein BGZ90_010593 [Linnemannia elongata]
MVYEHRQPSSLSGQQYHLHRHTQLQKPVILSPPLSNGSDSGSGTENEASHNKGQQQQLYTSAWKLKLRQQTMTQTQTQAQTQQLQQLDGDMAHATTKPNHTLTNEIECQSQNQLAHEKEWSTPAAMAHNLLKSFGQPSSNRGSCSSITTTSQTTEELKKSLERAFAACRNDDPVKWMIQTLFEIGTHCAQLSDTMQLHEDDEKRASQFVIDVFHTCRNRWIWGDAASTGNENGIKDQNNNNERSNMNNMNERTCSIEHMRGDMDKKKDKGDSGDLISLEDSDDEKEKEDLNDCMQVVARRNGHESNHGKDRLCPITQTHRQMLLDSILEGRSALQVFLAIDTFGLSDSLSIVPPIRGTKNNNASFDIEYEKVESNGIGDQNTNGVEQKSGADYGSLLIVNLIHHGYLHAAIHMTIRLRDFQHHHHLNQQQNGNRDHKEGQDEKEKYNVTLTSAHQLLASQLLDKGHLDLIHLFVNNDRELCRTVLQMIDSRFAGQIWAWIEGEVVDSSQLDPFLVVQCRGQASLSPPALSPTALSAIYPLQMLFGMLEVVNSLWMSFGLENTMKRFGSIQLIQEYCTALSLLLTNSCNLHNHTQCQTHYKPERHATHASENEFNLTRWIFIPSVLPILKQNPALQRLVVWACAMREDGVATAEFLASAFRLRAFFTQCVGHTSEKKDDDEQYRDEETKGQACCDGGAKKTTLLLEQPLTRVGRQSVDQDSNYNEGSPKGKENYSSNYECECTVLNGESKNKVHEAHNPSEFFDVQNTYTQPTPSPLQTKASSAPPSTPTFIRTSYLKQKKPLLIHRPHTTASNTSPKKRLLYSRHIPVLDYKPSPETSVILLNQMSQLQQLYNSLFNSDIVGMSLIRPLAKPWVNFKQHPEMVQHMLLLQQQQQQQQERQQEARKAKRDGTGAGEGGCAYLQLACSSDKRVYVIDLEVFLDKKKDPMHKFPRLLGEIFFNPSICKLAYNWKEESAYLQDLFPVLKTRQHRIDNFLDLYYIWIASSPNPNHNSNSSNNKIKAWYCGGQPIFPTRMLQPKFKNVSSLLIKVMERFLKRSSKLGWDAWLMKPLPVCLQQDLGM